MLASNHAAMAGKWLPYYFKPFLLGRQGSGAGSTDAEIYITQTVGSSNELLYGSCTSDHNCGFYYTLTPYILGGFHALLYQMISGLMGVV